MHAKCAPRRQHSADLKAKVLAACNEPGASISAVALAHGLNANLVRKWRAGRGLKRAGIATPVAVAAATTGVPMAPPAVRVVPSPIPLLASDARFVPIGMAAPTGGLRVDRAESAHAAAGAQALIQVELRRGALHLSVRWPTSAADDCTAWLRELSSGLLK